jgi:hypothetical protein
MQQAGTGRPPSHAAPRTNDSLFAAISYQRDIEVATTQRTWLPATITADRRASKHAIPHKTILK